MKKMFVLNLGILLLTSLFTPAFAQEDIVEDSETYMKANVAITKFKVLGVNRKQYAKTLVTENFLEPDRKLKLVTIDKTVFADNGQGYDLVANDGILTSNELFNYNGSQFVLPEVYQETTNYNTVVTDESFVHQISQTEKIKIKCKFKWVSCSAMPEPQRSVCYIVGWPFGGFTLLECEIEFDLPF